MRRPRPCGGRLPASMRSMTAASSGLLPSTLPTRPRLQSMASDSDYLAFLDKANGGAGAGASAKATCARKTAAVNTAVPAALQQVDAYYQSDADEPFEPVSLQWDRDSLPSAGMASSSNFSPSLSLDTQHSRFAEQLGALLQHSGAVSAEDEAAFDPRHAYRPLLDAVRRAGDGGLAVFRLHHSATRAEYFLLSLDRPARRLVGLSALAVES